MIHEDAVLLMGFGSPASLDELPEFLSRVIGQKPSPELVSRTRSRYARIAGSPFLEISCRQAGQLEELLSQSGRKLKVALGFLHGAPFIPEALSKLLTPNLHRLIGLPLIPFASSRSTGAYAHAAEEALLATGRTVEFVTVASYHDQPLFLEAVAEKLTQVFRENPGLSPSTTPVLFSAHSLPQALPDNPGYLAQLEASRKAVSERLGLDKTALAFQSRGGRGEWLGPSVAERVADWAAQGEKAVVVSPLGFVSDHVETLYDLDVELKGLAEGAGLRYFRAASLNDSPTFIRALAAVVEEKLG